MPADPLLDGHPLDQTGDRLLGPEVAERYAAGPGYLNTASVGLPPRDAVGAVRLRLEEWEAGRCDPPSFDTDVERARLAYARLVGTTAASVALVGQVSVASAMVAAGLPRGATVLCAEEDFTSVLFPFLADDRLTVRTVPLDALVDAVSPAIDLVAVSAVQSADGRVLDLGALATAAADAGSRTYLDLSQAAGWLPIGAERFDVTAAGAYKWLSGPRGSGFVTIGPHNDWLRPLYPGWYSGPDRWGALYGPPLRLTEDARRFDTSPAWFAVVGAARSSELLAELGVDAVNAHNVALANHFRSRIGLEPSNSAIVSVDGERGAALSEDGVTVAERGGRVRLSFHLYNSMDDADRAADAMGGPPG